MWISNTTSCLYFILICCFMYNTLSCFWTIICSGFPRQAFRGVLVCHSCGDWLYCCEHVHGRGPCVVESALLVVRLAWAPLPLLLCNITWPWASFSTSVSFSFLIYEVVIINTFFTALSEIMHVKCLARECLNMVTVEAGQELKNENIAVTCVLWFLGTHSQDCAFWVTG